MHVVFAAADARGAGRHDDVRGLQRVDAHRSATGPWPQSWPGSTSIMIWRCLPPKGAGRRQAGNGEQLDADEVEAVVEELLLGQRLAGDSVICTTGTLAALNWMTLGGVMPGGAMRRMRVVDRVDLGDGAADIGAGLEIDLEQADAGNGLGLDALDAVDGGGIGALADQDDAPLHVLGGQAGIVPGDQHDRNVDDREDVDDHARHREPAHQQDQQRHHRRRVGPAQRQDAPIPSSACPPAVPGSAHFLPRGGLRKYCRPAAAATRIDVFVSGNRIGGRGGALAKRPHPELGRKAAMSKDTGQGPPLTSCGARRVLRHALRASSGRGEEVVRVGQHECALPAELPHPELARRACRRIRGKDPGLPKFSSHPQAKRPTTPSNPHLFNIPVGSARIGA